MHPDKAGNASEEAFKEITEAANKVHSWITENPELQKTNTEEYKKYLNQKEKKEYFFLVPLDCNVIYRNFQMT